MPIKRFRLVWEAPIGNWQSEIGNASELIDVTPQRSASRQLMLLVSSDSDKGCGYTYSFVEGLDEVSELKLPWPTVWTIGHSTRSERDFIHILKTHQISTLADVRSFPGSRRYPQFNGSTLSESLAGEGIVYHHLPTLGGRRQPSLGSKNTAWRNSSFRAYADHMETLEFKQGIGSLRELACECRTAVMCAEALWWRCHRSLIADYLKALGAIVIHISDEKQTEIHPYTSAARIIQGRLSYEGLFSEQGDALNLK